MLNQHTGIHCTVTVYSQTCLQETPTETYHIDFFLAVSFFILCF